MAKNKKAAKEVTLQQVAEELNDVMQYGVDPETGEVDESEQIDVELKDKALKAAILEEAGNDLRTSDEESFSPEVWQWFLDNGITPAEGDEDEGGEDEDEEEKPAKKSSKDKKASKKADPEDEDDDEDEAPKSKKSSKKEEKPAKKAAAKKEKGVSFEQIAIDIVEGGGGKKELLKKFTALYEERGKDDPDFIAKRVDIYYNIACKELGVEPEADKKASKKDEKSSSKKADKKASKAEPEDDGDDADEDEDEAPKKSSKKSRK